MEVMEKEKKRKLPLGVRILLLPFKIILIILVIGLAWFAYCRFDRIKPIDALPSDYALYLRTDKVWNTVEPLLDLNATLVAMTSPELQKYRETYLKIKSSKLRRNAFVKFALKRRVDAAVYADKADGEITADKTSSSNFIAVLDTGVLAGAARLAPFALPHIKKLQGKIELCTNRHGPYYMISDNGYVVLKKNLVLFTNSRDLLEEAMGFACSGLYKPAELASMNEKLKEPLRILANGRYIAALSKEGALQNYLSAVSPYLAEDEYAVLNFGITNNELDLSINVPMVAGGAARAENSQSAETSQSGGVAQSAGGAARAENSQSAETSQRAGAAQPHPVVELLKKESQVPSLLPKFTEDV